MKGKCTNKNCFPDISCALGYLDRNDCEHWQPDTDVEKTDETTDNRLTTDFPWNGYALGKSDLMILSGRGQPLVVSLVGPPDSGKTSLLAFVYMLLLKNGKLGNWDFAGSWTLGGWESVVQYCRWSGSPPPSFPPHTSSAGRQPGVLHVTLRHHVSASLRDVFFTDAPGEWFTQWARVPGDSTADGARWVINNADVILLLIDSAALADPENLPQARRAARDLIERVGSENEKSPIMVLWTKDDVEVPEEIQDGLARSYDEFLPNANLLRTTIYDPASIEQCFVQAIRTADKSGSMPASVEPQLSTDPFLAFRGIYVKA